jgi:glycosyltransferase involved in cell wall biosynthesis
MEGCGKYLLTYMSKFDNLIQATSMKNCLETALVYGYAYRLFGGSYMFKYYLSRALIELGYETWLFGVSIPNINNIVENFGKELLKLKVFEFPLPPLIKRSIYSRFTSIWLFKFVLSKLKPNIVFVDHDLYRNSSRNLSVKIVEYMHGLSEAQISSPIAIRYRQSIWRGYYKLYQVLYRGLARKNPFNEADIVLTNSHYTAKLIKRFYGEKPRVLYPPVDVEVFRMYSHKTFEERRGIITVGRIGEDFNHEVLIKLAKFIDEPVIIVVAISDPDYYRKLKTLIKREGVEKKVRLYVSVSRSKLLELLSNAKIFVNTHPYHTFGISVVEAMASGLPVVTVRGGAVYYDIVENCKFGFSYSDLGELIHVITSLLTDEDKWAKYSKVSAERANFFSYELFKERINDILKRL